MPVFFPCGYHGNQGNERDICWLRLLQDFTCASFTEAKTNQAISIKSVMTDLSLTNSFVA